MRKKNYIWKFLFRINLEIIRFLKSFIVLSYYNSMKVVARSKYYSNRYRT